MPLVRIDLKKGRPHHQLTAIMDITITTIKEVLKLPADDTNIRLTEFDPAFFRMKQPYNIIIEISLFAGRSIDTKRILYKQITGNLHQQLGINPTEVFILLNDQPRENWGVRGGVAGCDLDLGFKVDI